MVIEVNDLKKWNYARLVTIPFDHSELITTLEKIPRGEHIKLIQKKTDNPLNYHAAILDFEGNPVFLIGIMIYNSLFSFFIEDYDYRIELYLLLLNVFSNNDKLVYFTFSNHEKEEIKKICQYLEYQNENLSDYIPVDMIPIINLQLNSFESLLEALYSIQSDMKITGDALFRNTRLVDQLFYAKKYNEVVYHNQNCLKNESIILKKRWLKLYTV